jgi:hypothetical protein
MSRSDFILQQQQQQQNLSQQRKATSLKTISVGSKILYPINSQTNNIDQSWYQKHSSSHNKVPTSDSGIVIDTDGTRLTSKSSIEEVRLMSIIIFCFTNSIKTCTRDRKSRRKKIEVTYVCFDRLLFLPKASHILPPSILDSLIELVRLSIGQCRCDVR